MMFAMKVHTLTRPSHLFVKRDDRFADERLRCCKCLPGDTCNKIDKKPDYCQSPDNSTYPFDVSTNALTGQGLAELVVTIGSRLGDNLPESGKPALLNKRQWEIMKQSLCTDSPEQISQHLGHLLGHHHG